MPLNSPNKSFPQSFPLIVKIATIDEFTQIGKKSIDYKYMYIIAYFRGE